MWPERRALVEFGANPTADYNESENYFVFFSVGPTLGLVHKPVVVSMEEFCVGWIGKRGRHSDEIYPGSTSKIHVKGTKGCCNQRLVAIAGARKSTNESGLFGSSEFDFESDVLEVIFTETRGTGGEFLCVVHINLNTFVANVEHSLTVPLEVIGECNVSEKGIKAESLTQPLVDRSSGEVVTLSEGSPSARKLIVEALSHLGKHMQLADGAPSCGNTLWAEEQILQLLAAEPNTITTTTKSSTNARYRQIRRCYVGWLPLWVLVECIWKRPERRLVVTMEDNNESQECFFFSASWTLGIVMKPVYVTMDDRCVGWLGGMNFLTFDSDGLSAWKALHTEGTAECISSWKMQVRKVCCNQRWVVVAGSYCEMSGLFVSTVENCQPNCRQGSFLRYPWIDGVLSLRFLCFSEYECESSVVEAIYAEKRGSSEFVCVEHINLSTETSVSSQLVCECELPEIPFGGISTPLVNRADGTYYLLNGSSTLLPQLLVLNTGKTFDMHGHEAVDEMHFATLSEQPTEVPVYSLTELPFDKATPCHVHRFAPGTRVNVGCGMVISSSVSILHHFPQNKPRLSEAAVFPLS
ncbi:hypothetical protein Pelo_7883 [Pelomyxa schiedti]|nr:hypothetical protein Pelo_7883 [Pelomyxa schiedti]